MTPLRHAWQSERYQPMVSRVTAAELIRILAYLKFKLSPDEQQELLADYLPWCTTVRIPNPPPETPECRDPFDLPFLQLAIVGKADYLVSGDQDLLSLAGQFACPIVTADQFIKTLNEWLPPTSSPSSGICATSSRMMASLTTSTSPS